ncbi:MAG: hypothetical protein M0P72_12270 [Metallibacterium scheffleri]|uniref:hypothetical protein n=1 Tax=Metallibacterium scheffleri TaxID=993689 RepID=UPI0026F174E1|nr:hypothetical protein [Metallibacterium scheffleri]MCK9367907.1 hypothetical protein [Metallibacterium scheffleri]
MSYLRMVQPNRAAQGAGSASAHCLIAQLPDHRGASITGQYRLTGATDVSAATPRLQLTLADATGTVLGFVWPEHREHVQLPPVGRPVEVEASVRRHEGRPQLCITRLDGLGPDQVDVAADVICGAGQERNYGLLRALEVSLPQPLRGFLARVLLDPGIGPPFLACRASCRHHHAKHGGLVAHSLENLDLIGSTVRRTLPDDPVSVAIAQAGYLLHDIGKIRTVGASDRPVLHHVVRHETHNLLLLAPHLEWLRSQAAEVHAGLSYVLEYLATPAASRARARYFPAEVVVQFDQWSAAAHARRDIKALCRPGRSRHAEVG